LTPEDVAMVLRPGLKEITKFIKDGELTTTMKQKMISGHVLETYSFPERVIGGVEIF